MYLFFDTETTGLPKDYNASFKDVDNWPRIIQLAWAVFNSEGKCFKKSETLILPDGWVIPNEDFWIYNGLTQDESLKNGKPIKGALEQFIIEVDDNTHLIAHNMKFDLNIVAAEMFRLGIKSSGKINKICTMQSTIDLLKLPGKYGFKYPKLEELHNHLFNEGFDGAHDALNDVMATAKCFFELKKRNQITINEPV